MAQRLVPASMSPGAGASFSPRWKLLAALALAGVSLLAALGLASSYRAPLPFFIIVGLGVLLVLVWRRPILGLYLAVGIALTIESFPLAFPDSLTDRLPVFHSVNVTGLGISLPMAPADVLLLATLAIVALQRMAGPGTGREASFRLGPLFPFLAFYIAVVLFGLANGLSRGGTFALALWEVRPQFYLLLAYLLAVNLVQERGQLQRLMWVFLVAVAFKAFLGLWRYLVTLGGDLSIVSLVSNENSILAHEESAFLDVFLVFPLVLFLLRGNRRQLTFSALCALPVLVMMLANQRRAGFLGLFLAVAIVGLVAYALLPSRRRVIAVSFLLGGLGLVAYMAAVGSNPSSRGLTAQPARAIVSLYQPDERDLSSNEYRIAEARNVQLNIEQAPFLGLGYGKAMEQFIPIPNFGVGFTLGHLIPHNTILWVWMRVGLLGFLAFWMLVAAAVARGLLQAARATDPYMRSVALLTVAALAVWLVQAFADMGLAEVRLMLFMGALMGVLSRLPDLQTLDGPPDKRSPDRPTVAQRLPGRHSPRTISWTRSEAPALDVRPSDRHHLVAQQPLGFLYATLQVAYRLQPGQVNANFHQGLSNLWRKACDDDVGAQQPRGFHGAQQVIGGIGVHDRDASYVNDDDTGAVSTNGGKKLAGKLIGPLRVHDAYILDGKGQGVLMAWPVHLPEVP